MSHRSFVAIFIAAVLAAGLLVGCRDSLSPAETVAASGERFAEVESFRLLFDVRGLHDQSGPVEGEAGYDAGELVYSSKLFRGEPAILFLPPDLYLRADLYLRSPDTWYVLSPWDQGVPRDELPEIGPDELTIEYGWAVDRLSDIEQHDDEAIDGEDYLHYAGALGGDQSSSEDAPDEADEDALALRPFGITATALDVELWLDSETYLPRKMRLRGKGRLRATFEFLEYGEPVASPEVPANVRPFRDVELASGTCVGPRLAACMEAQDQLRSIASESCKGTDKRICIAPFGQVSPSLVEHLVAYYRDEYGLTVSVLVPEALPEQLVDSQREQVGASALIAHMGSLFPDVYTDSSAVLIGLTPVDLYHETSHFRYVFGIKGTPAQPHAVISTFRMNPETYGEHPDEAVLFSRTRKLFSKYVGLLYYQLPPSSDPTSPMYNSILGPDDLDRMEEPLPVASAP